MEWEPRFEVGVLRLDSQHKILFAIVNEFSDAAEDGTDKEVLMKALYRFLTYAMTHFADEEKCLLTHGYPGLTEHAAEHDRGIAKVRELIARFSAGERPAAETLHFLKAWLTQHLLGADQLYVPLLAAEREA